MKNVQVLRKEPLIRDRVLCSDGRAIVWLRVSLFNIDLLALDDESRYMSESLGRRVIVSGPHSRYFHSFTCDSLNVQ